MAGIQTLRLALDAAAALGQIRGVQAGFNGITSAAKDATSTIDKLINPLENIQSILLGFATFKGIQGLSNVADSYTEMGNKIRGVVKDQAEFLDIQDRVAQAAANSRTGLGVTTDLFAKLSTSLQGLGKGNVEAVNLTETINKLAKAGGMAKSSVEGGLYQLGQGLGSGKLAGDEFKSVRENLPAVAQAIAQGLGVPIGKLKELSAQGKLTSKVVVEALEAAGNKGAGAFAVLPQTFGEALTQAENKWIKFVGTVSEESGLSTYFASVVKVASDALFGVGTNTKDIAKTVGEGIINIFELLVRGVARVADMLTPIFNLIKTALNSFIKSYNDLPSWAQEIGVVGVAIFGVDFAKKMATYITITDYILGKFGKSLSDFLPGDSKGTKGKGAIQQFLYGDEDPEQYQKKAEGLLAAVREQFNKTQANKGNPAQYGSNRVPVDNSKPDTSKEEAKFQRLVEKYQNILIGIENKANPYEASLKEQNKQLGQLNDLTTKHRDVMKELNLTDADVARTTADLVKYWTRQNDLIGQATEQMDIQSKVLKEGQFDREAELAYLNMKQSYQLRGIKITDDVLAQLANYKKRVQANADAGREDQFQLGQTQRLRSLTDEGKLIGLVGEARDRRAAELQLQQSADQAGIKDSTKYVREYMAAYDDLTRRTKASKTAQLGFAQAIDDYLTRVQDMASQTRDALGSVFSSLEDQLANFIKTGKFSFKDFVSTINNELAKIAAKQLIGLGLNLAGFRAEGGPVIAGQTYMVGEKGPELFTAKTTGSIIPNNVLASASSSSASSSGGQTININMAGITVQGGAPGVNYSALEPKFRNAIIKVIADEKRSGGILSK